MGKQLGNRVGTAGIEGSALVLRNGLHLAEHLRGRGLIEFDGRVHFADRLEHARDAERIDVCGEQRLLERNPDEALGAEIVDLVWFGLGDRPAKIGVLEKLKGNERKVALADAELVQAPQIE